MRETETESVVRALVIPLLKDSDVQIYDIEFTTGVLRVALDRPGGIDVDTIGEMSHSISRVLDDNDVVPGSRYMLEVTSPGIERKLRRPEHFVAMVGARAKVKVRNAAGAARRLEGVIRSASDDSIELEFEVDGEPEVRTIQLNEIESARSVFDWATVKEVSEEEIGNDEKKASAR